MPNRATYEELERKVKELERELRSSVRRLEESEQLHETLIERNLHPVAIIDAEGRYLDANQAFLAFVQMEKERLLTMAVFDFAPPGKRPKQETNHRPVWETGGTLETEYFINGDIRTLELAITPVTYQGKKAVIGIGKDITGRKRQEDELSFRGMLLDGIQDCITATDLYGNITYVNEAELFTLKSTREELLGKSVTAFGEDPSRGATQTEIINETIKNGEWRGEVINYASDGTEIILDCRTKLIKNSKGEPWRMVGISTDITERKQAEAALWKSEKTFRTIIDTALEGIWITDKEGLTTYVNHEVEALLGYSLEEMIGKRMSDCLSQADGEACETRIEKGAQEVGGRHDIRFRRKDGRELLAIVSATPMLDAKGEVGGTFSMITDMTDRKEAEEELQTIFSMSLDLICIADINSAKFKKVNPSFTRILGYSEEELLGRPFLDFIHPEDIQSTIDILEKELKPGKRVINFENRYRCKNGEYCWLNWTSHPRPERGVTFAVARDETDRKKLESQLRQSQKMESIGTLAGGIAHDFNNALTPIILQTELAKLTIPGDNPVQRGLDQIMKAGHRAKDLVGQILAFSRQAAQQRVSMDLTPMIKESLKLLRSSIPTTIEIRQDIEGGPCPVWADPTQMQQIIMNLCTNASHAMQETGGFLEVDLKTVALGTEAAKAYPNIGPGRYVMLSVSDTGVGIEPELMEKIFDPFFTTKPVNEGTGMGLSVVHGIVRSHEGDITVRSEPEKGATFSVLLPRLAREAKVETVVRNGSVPTGSERILFVDDEETVVKVGEQILKKLGYYVESTTQAVEALATFREQPDRYDLVITDMTMPNMTGEDLAKALMRVRLDIPVIICTGFSHQMDEEKALGMGIRAFVMKPFDFKDVAQTIRKVLDSDV